LHGVSDSLIALAYFSIPATLLYFIRRRRDAPYPGLFFMFGAFIILCGLTHVCEVWTIWNSAYYLTGGVKAATAAVSLATAGVLIRLTPQALQLRGPVELQRLNEELETRVKERTSELEQANAALRREIAQRKRSEAEIVRLNGELQRRLVEQHALFAVLPVGVGVAEDSECRSIRTNDTFARMLNINAEVNASLSSPPNRNQLPFRVTKSGKTLEPHELPMQACARENRSLTDFEETIERNDGSQIHVIANAVPLRDEAGRVTGCVATFQDITARKALEEELKLVIEAAPSALLKLDEQGKIILVNEQAEQLFGYPRAELLGRAAEDLVPARFREGRPDSKSGFFDSPSKATSVLPGDLFIVRKSGAEVPVEISVNPVHTSGGPSRLVSVTDISERRQAESHRLAVERKLQETQKLESLGVLAGGVAHDFNNLLTGVLGNASLARTSLPTSAPTQDMLEQIEMSARRAADLCKQMLAYSGRGRFVVGPVDINRLVTDTTHLLKISISKSCVLRFHLAPSLPAVEADATQIRQIIMNLVINASEAVGDASGVIAISTGVARVNAEYLETIRYNMDLKPGDYVVLEVSDSGCGMDEATIARIFDPFFSTKFTGRGLGLAAVLGIVRGHLGGLKVYSEPGRGTTFKLLLPSTTAPAVPPPVAASEPDDSWRGYGTVLVVDDEESVRTVAARVLENLGYDVELAEDGREGVEKFRSNPAGYQLVLLDLTMPHMDGEEAFRQMRHMHPGVRVLLMSGFNEHDATSRFAGKGLAGFVQKPFEIDALMNSVRTVALAT
jgi:PAS domain S-box-containing protein